MRKILISIFILITTASIFTSCNKENNRENKHSILQSLNDRLDLESREEVHIYRIEKKEYLVGYLDDIGYMVNPNYYIYNDETGQFIQVHGQIDYIKEVWVEDGEINLYSEGDNVINGFRKFPSISKVNIKDGSIKNEQVYFPIGYDNRQHYMGNYLNETKLNGIIANENSIRYDFALSENTIIAGGQFCPNISINSSSQNKININIQGLVYDEEIFKGIRDADWIQNAIKKDYIDVNRIKNSTIQYTVEGFSEYSCQLIEGEDGVFDLVICFS